MRFTSLRSPFFILVAALCLLLLAWAATGRTQAPITATITADPRQLTVGDPVQLTVQINHPTTYQVQPLPIESAWGPLEILETAAPEVHAAGNDQATTTLRLRATLWSPGAFQTPPLPVILVDAGGEQVEILTDSLTLTVISVLDQDDPALRDIRPQATLPYPWPWLAMVGLFLLAALVGGAAAWPYLRRRQTVPASRTPVQIALAELDQVLARSLPAQGQIKTHYTMVSHVLRRYLARAYGIPTASRTTTETTRGLANASISPEQTACVQALLNEADQVKFGGQMPATAVAIQYGQRARHFLQQEEERKT